MVTRPSSLQQRLVMVMVKRLLDNDADLNIQNSMGWTALMRVAANGFIYHSPSQNKNCSIDQKQIFPNIHYIISF